MGARPAYVDAPVPEAALRREHAMARVHEPAFSRAFLKLSRNLLDAGTKKELLVNLRAVEADEMTVGEVVDAIPLFNAADPLSEKLWNMLGISLARAINSTVEDAGESEVRSQGWNFSFEVEKAAPVNPFSTAYVRERAASLVADISDSQRKMLQELIADALERGIRPTSILKEIEEVIGLTSREAKAVQNRKALLAAEGIPKSLSTRQVDRYAQQLLSKRARRIARTETIMAYTKGLEDSWTLAQENGDLEPTVLKEWIEITLSPRTCKICRGLARQRVPLGESFVSGFIGPVDRPPAHPQCRCSLVLVTQPTEEEQKESIREAQRANEIFAGRESGSEGPGFLDILTQPGKPFRDASVRIDTALSQNRVTQAAAREALRLIGGEEALVVAGQLIDNPAILQRLARDLRSALPTVDVSSPTKLLRSVLGVTRGKVIRETIVRVDNILSTNVITQAAARGMLRRIAGEEGIVVLDAFLDDPDLLKRMATALRDLRLPDLEDVEDTRDLLRRILNIAGEI